MPPHATPAAARITLLPPPPRPPLPPPRPPQSLALGSNRLTGSLPAGLALSLNIELLTLSQNNLSGPIPDAWAGLHHLTVLDLSDNPRLVSARYGEAVLDPWLAFGSVRRLGGRGG